MEIKKEYKVAAIIFAIIALLGIGFLMGRSTIEEKTKVEIKYVKGETVRDTIREIKPIKEVVPADTADIIRECVRKGLYAELFPEREVIIEIEKYKPTSVDTLAIIKDWGTKRHYDEVLFDNDTLGRLAINADLQYNRISSIGYDFAPMQKEVTTTVYKKPTFSPFIGVGVGYEPYGMVQAGTYIKEKHGFGVTYFIDANTKKQYGGINYFYKF